MNVGKPQRVHRVEPIRSPVPAKPAPDKAPSVPSPDTPAIVSAR